MTEQNRVTPFGDIVAIPLRGALTGNRGQLHLVDDHGGHEIVRFHGGDLWITCALQFRGRWSPQWQPGHYTFLFFHDEAVSLAAGHRPCAECRRPSYNAYRAGWAAGSGGDLPTAQEMNRQLHRERIVAGTHRRQLHAMSWAGLPGGTFVRVDGSPFLVLDDHIVEWTPSGYAECRTRPRNGHVDVVTPPSSVAVLLAGYPVQVDPSIWVAHSAAIGDSAETTPITDF